MNRQAFEHRLSAIERIQSQLEAYTDKFWERYEILAKEVLGEFHDKINFADDSSDNYRKGIFGSPGYRDIDKDRVLFMSEENFRGTNYYYYYSIPSDVFFDYTDDKIKSILVVKLDQYHKNVAFKNEKELEAKKVQLEKLKKELEPITQ